MLRSLNVRVADASTNNVSTVCYQAVRERTVTQCRDMLDTVYDLPAYLLFQGLTNATYIRMNSTDTSIASQAVAMIESGQIDTEHAKVDYFYTSRDDMTASVTF
jgi:hypothetical protein